MLFLHTMTYQRFCVGVQVLKKVPFKVTGGYTYNTSRIRQSLSPWVNKRSFSFKKTYGEKELFPSWANNLSSAVICKAETILIIFIHKVPWSSSIASKCCNRHFHSQDRKDNESKRHSEKHLGWLWKNTSWNRYWALNKKKRKQIWNVCFNCVLLYLGFVL